MPNELKAAKLLEEENLPLAVQNLRKIWNSKKYEMDFNQITAAAELGWSQSAISHYLNNITDLGPGAVVKFANFLHVDPLEIDPSIISKLPHVTCYNVVADTKDLTKQKNEAVYSRGDIESFYVELPTGTKFEDCFGDIIKSAPDPHIAAGAGSLRTFIRLCDPKKYTANKLVGVRLKGEKKLRIYSKKAVPVASRINKKWAVISITHQ